jgi:hypothetical protein
MNAVAPVRYSETSGCHPGGVLYDEIDSKPKVATILSRTIEFRVTNNGGAQ